MPEHRPPHAGRQRQQIAELAARYMHQDGLDIARARAKAAHRLGLDVGPGNPLLPRSEQIHAALQAQLALYGGHRQCLQQQRQAALEAMDFLLPFSPRLAGPVLEGNALPHDPVCLHLHSNAPEDVAHFLHDTRLQARLANRTLRLPPGRRQDVPCWLLEVDGQTFELWVLPSSALRHGPLQPLQDTPQPRAGIARLRALLEQAG
jgi:hypothetical protein